MALARTGRHASRGWRPASCGKRWWRDRAALLARTRGVRSSAVALPRVDDHDSVPTEWRCQMRPPPFPDAPFLDTDAIQFIHRAPEEQAERF